MGNDLTFRPKGWKNPYYSHTHGDALMSITESCAQPEINRAYEAGADAMMEGLKSRGAYQSKEWVDDEFGLRTIGGGYLVFIPEDTNE